ncbi:PREDICTED: uncharacterized protein LOC107346752 [Paramuricea clavata]|uniref:PREDICTED: uncharacterized protein LOC107346752 n=1 Tax=Paramuricea clavata TaxID=317549 RepID=A0A7D9HW65_PARCT|nr:PREDICTED: uncharacterized protein LOC107346752 [Paramuricea clavata]
MKWLPQDMFWQKECWTYLRMKINKDACEENKTTAEFFVSYIKEVELRKVGCARLVDLVSFWTAGSTIGYNDELLMVKFNADCKLPMAETCFMGIVLPTRHTSYDDFRKHMDIALRYGSKGFDFI